jgi:putative transposase
MSARRLIEQAILAAGIREKQLTIHADRGSAMKSQPLAQLLEDLHVGRSHSRPRVSNDNPFSESQFKTLKYHSDFPGRFSSDEHALEWCREFFPWYNEQHRHEGIGFFTPADVHFGRHERIDRARQAALDTAYARNPERFVRGRPSSPAVPEVVWINRPDETTVEIQEAEAPALPGGRGGSPGGRGANGMKRRRKSFC